MFFTAVRFYNEAHIESKQYNGYAYFYRYGKVKRCKQKYAVEKQQKEKTIYNP
jgi:hypothetical protein